MKEQGKGWVSSRHSVSNSGHPLPKVMHTVYYPPVLGHFLDFPPKCTAVSNTDVRNSPKHVLLLSVLSTEDQLKVWSLFIFQMLLASLPEAVPMSTPQCAERLSALPSAASIITETMCSMVSRMGYLHKLFRNLHKNLPIHPSVCLHGHECLINYFKP